MIGHLMSMKSKHATRFVVAIALTLIGSMAMPARTAAQFPPVALPIDDLPVLVPLTNYPPTVATSAAGPFVPLAAWDQTFPPNQRFVILTNFKADAVLDRETGLVWPRQAVVFNGEREFHWRNAGRLCSMPRIGSRTGWRLPTRAELATLIDPSQPVDPGSPRLPPGHPFLLYEPFQFWTSEDQPFFYRSQGSDITMAHAPFAVHLASGGLQQAPVDVATAQALCVRSYP
jgi:uncharacterized protein DUF1566